MLETLAPALYAILGYLLGSIPFGLVLTKLAGEGDIRQIGSGNIGATNVLRTGNKLLAAATLALDMLKGTAAVLIARYVSRGTPLADWAPMIAGLAAFIGHIFPVWLKFKGGKGVATFLGVLLGLVWQTALATAGVWLLAAIVFRYSSLAALIATASAPLIAWYFGGWQLALVVAVLALIVWIKHHENIARLLSGRESKIGAK